MSLPELSALHQRYLNGERLCDLEQETPYRKGSLGAAFRRYGFPALGKAGPRAKVGLDDPRTKRALHLWDNGWSAKAAAHEVGFSQSLMTRLLRASGRKGQRIGPLHSAWKGGTSKVQQGYVRVWVSPDDEFASMRRDGGNVFEHRLVVARHLGRSLEPHETVHHINGDRADNRIENLQLRVGHHGPGATYVCADCGSHRITAGTV